MKLRTYRVGVDVLGPAPAGPEYAAVTAYVDAASPAAATSRVHASFRTAWVPGWYAAYRPRLVTL